MTPRAAARRYAGALFDVAQMNNNLSRIRADLDAVAALVAGHDELTRVIESPTVPAAKKRALMGAIIDAGGGTSAEVRRLVLMLADHDRLSLLAEVTAQFGERVMKASRIMAAEVVTAVPLPETSRSALARALGKATGSEITMTERIDPSIVGGVVARVGSVVFDGSVTRQIERLRQKLRTQA